MSWCRRLLLKVTAVALLGVGGFAVYLWHTSPATIPGVTWQKFCRLRSGMSARHVKALLGERYLREVGRLVGSDQYEVALIEERDEAHGPLAGTLCWQSEEVAIYLSFEADRLMSGEAFRGGYGRHGVPLPLAEETFFDRIRK
jgi:hypothetical protein